MNASVSEKVADSILIVDDSPDSLQVLSDILTARGYDVRGARNGMAAMDVIDNDPPDLVLLDIHTPDLDEFDVCRRLKTDERHTHLPVIFLSALQDTQEQLKGFEAGCVDFISKPFQAEEVLARVHTHVTLRNLQNNLQKEVNKRTTALTESETRYRSMIDASPVSIMAIRDGCFVSINPAGCRMLGYSGPDELIGMPTMKVVAPESQAHITERIQRLESGQSNPTAEAILVKKDGAEITIESSSVSVPIDEKMTSMVFAHDISHRKKMEMRLKESEERFRAFMNHIPAAIYIKNQNDEHIYCNPEASKAVALDPDDVVGKTTRDLFPSEIADRLIELDREVLNENNSRITEEYINPEGSVIHWRKDIKFPIKLSSGNKLLGGIAIDISDLKQTEMALSEQIEFERLIADIALNLSQTSLEQLDPIIDSILGTIGRFLMSDRAFIAQFSNQDNQLTLSNTWADKRIENKTQVFEMNLVASITWVVQQINEGKAIMAGPGLTGLPDEAQALRNQLEKDGITSVVVVPMLVEGRAIGLLGLDTIGQPREYPPRIVDRIKLVGNMIGTAINRIRAEAGLREQLAFEDLLSRLSATFIHIRASEIDNSIEHGLNLVAEFLNVQRCNLFLFSKDNKELHLIIAYAVEGVEESPQILFSDEHPWFTNRLLSGEPYCFSSLEELPPEAAAEKAYLEQVGVKSAVVMPLMAAGVSHGGITLSSLTEERHWSDKLIQQLSTVADVFSNALLRKSAHAIIEQRLEVESLLANLATGFINLSVDEADKFLEVAMRKISELFGVDRSSILQFDADLSELCRTHIWEKDGINPDPHGLPIRVHEQFPILFNRLKNAETIIIPDAETMPDDDAAAYCQAIGIQSFIMLPLIVGRHNLGAIVLSTIYSKMDFTDNQVKQFRLFSTIVANALARQRQGQALEKSRQNAQMLAGRLLTIQESERKRLARELHDDLSQRLAVLAMSASRVHADLSPLSTEATDTIQTMQRQLVKISEDVHAISRQLHPSTLEDLGLVDAVRNEINAFRRREGIRIDYRVADIPEHLPRDIALCFFRIIQEGLRNIAKHARADAGVIDLFGEPDRLVMVISDQGCGFDMENSQDASGLGLISMRERIKMVNGRFAITSSPGNGTRIEVLAPIQASDY